MKLATQQTAGETKTKTMKTEELRNYARQNQKKIEEFCEQTPDGYYPALYYGENGNIVLSNIQIGWDTRRTQLNLGCVGSYDFETAIQ